ncbi:hypothetical protein PENANT_c072G07734 [Penicillium antarcticum]|uniref:Uncharacterized protein n=1 Tax=Penicillium antarcticum TaxID=416450 RepID=A0A1V6PPR7_9EURO|nr:hypothetical protein PENANT_c072G07734 [Penicillium antarcticum]
MVGYVNVVDAGLLELASEDESISEDEPESKDENHYRGMYMEYKQVAWGDWGM